MDLAQKAALLREKIQALGSVLVAYSGGADSAYLAYSAHEALGDRMLAVIADSASLPRAELEAALAFAAEHRIPVQVLPTAELDKPEYARNDSQRCFHCKDELFTVMEEALGRLGFAHLAYGMNADDTSEFRPGQQAAAQHQVCAPLADAGLTKAEVRALAREAGLSIWEKPASACLSSRIEYGRAVTAENLMQVEQAEDALHRLGFPQVRVRHHGELARVEIARIDLPRALDLAMLDKITVALRGAGFLYVTLDTQGYRSGSMNEVLPVSAIGAAAKVETRVTGGEETVAVLETAVDDMTAEVLAYVAEQAMAAGALDVMLQPVVMKKGRPGTLVTVLCRETAVSTLQELLLRETSTLGVRIRREKRVFLERSHVAVETPYGRIRIKTGSRGSEELNAAPEFEDCKAAAQKYNVALKQVMQAAMAAHIQATEREGQLL